MPKVTQLLVELGSECGVLDSSCPCCTCPSGLCLGQLDECEMYPTRREEKGLEASVMSWASGLTPCSHENVAGLCQLQSWDLRGGAEKRPSPPLKSKWQGISNFTSKSDTHVGSKLWGGSHLVHLNGS